MKVLQEPIQITENEGQKISRTARIGSPLHTSMHCIW